MRKRPVSVILIAICLTAHLFPMLQAQVKFAPADFGQTVTGFQDDFTGATRDPNWVAVPPEKDNYDQANGVLTVTVIGEGAFDTHLLYEAPGYDDTVQEVLARIRVTSFGLGDAARCGAAVAVDPESSQGINLHFRDHAQDGLQGRQFKLLDDRRAWGPRGLDIKWEDNAWYWLRLRQTGPGTDAANNIQGKVWLADGSVPEPGNWQLNWRRSGRTGFAGIVGSSIGGVSEYEVDYILIKAEGLPAIKVGSSAFPAGAPAAPKIAAARSGNAITLTWTEGGALESSDNISGPWSAIAGASSPHTATLSGVARFYRVRR